VQWSYKDDVGCSFEGNDKTINLEYRSNCRGDYRGGIVTFEANEWLSETIVSAEQATNRIPTSEISSMPEDKGNGKNNCMNSGKNDEKDVTKLATFSQEISPKTERNDPGHGCAELSVQKVDALDYDLQESSAEQESNNFKQAELNYSSDTASQVSYWFGKQKKNNISPSSGERSSTKSKSDHNLVAKENTDDFIGKGQIDDHLQNNEKGSQKHAEHISSHVMTSLLSLSTSSSDSSWDVGMLNDYKSEDNLDLDLTVEAAKPSIYQPPSF